MTLNHNTHNSSFGSPAIMLRPLHSLRHMSCERLVLFVMLLTMALALLSFTPTLSAQDQDSTLDAVADRVRLYEPGESRVDLSALADFVTGALHDHAIGRDEVQAALLGILEDEDATDAAKRFACRQLARVGTPEAAAVLGELLLEEATHSAALEALFQIRDFRDPRATLALVAATDVLEGRELLAVINALRDRGDAQACLGLLRSINLSSDEARLAALCGAVTADPVTVLDELMELDGNISHDGRDHDARAMRAAVHRALIDCGYALHDIGNDEAATRAFQHLMPKHPSSAAPLEAVRGLLVVDTDAQANALLRQLDLVRTVAGAGLRPSVVIDALVDAPGDRVTRIIETALASGQYRQAQSRWYLVATLGRRGDPQSEDALLGVIRSSFEFMLHPTLFEALAEVGGPASVPPLIWVATLHESDDTRAHAIEALVSLHHGDVDQALVAVLKDPITARRIEAVRVLSQRNAAEYGAAVIDHLRHEPDRNAQQSMLQALPGCVDGRHLAKLIDICLDESAKLHSNSLFGRTSLVDALDAACRNSDAPADAVAQLIDAAGNARSGVRRPLLSAAARQGGEQTFALVTSLLTGDGDDDDDLDALAALGQWPNALPADLLLHQAETRDDPCKAEAMRGAVRMLTLPGEADGVTRLDWARRLLSLTDSDKDTYSIVRQLGSLGTVEALDNINQRLTSDDLNMRKAALTAIIALAQTHGPERSDAILAALQRGRDSGVPTPQQVNAIDASMQHIDQARDFVHTWIWAGPYFAANTGGGDLMDIVFDPETGRDSVAWQAVPSDAIRHPGIIDLNQFLSGTNRCAYLRTVIMSDAERAIRFETGSDDGIKIWLNGAVVHANNVMRGHGIGTDVVETTLRKGANTLLMKITQGGGGWEASCRVLDAQGNRLDGVTFTR